MASNNNVPADSPSVIAEVAAGQGITFCQAARLMPPNGSGRQLNPSTVWRWCRDGVRLPGGTRVRLEACRVGCRWLTSQAAVARFLAAQNPPAAASPPVAAPRPPAGGGRKKRRPNVESELDRLGL
jgi:hypothetical protein